MNAGWSVTWPAGEGSCPTIGHLFSARELGVRACVRSALVETFSGHSSPRHRWSLEEKTAERRKTKRNDRGFLDLCAPLIFFIAAPIVFSPSYLKLIPLICLFCMVLYLEKQFSLSVLA